jgi:hypothetical protein
MIALAQPGFARRSQSAGGFGNPLRVPMIALAQPGFARRSQSAGGFGNPLRVPITTSPASAPT